MHLLKLKTKLIGCQQLLVRGWDRFHNKLLYEELFTDPKYLFPSFNYLYYKRRKAKTESENIHVLFVWG